MKQNKQEKQQITRYHLENKHFIALHFLSTPANFLDVESHHFILL